MFQSKRGAVQTGSPRLLAELARQYESAIRLLHRELKAMPKDIRWDLASRLVEQCEAARRAKDPYKRQRNSDQRAMARAGSLAKAAKTIAQYCRNFPELSSFIVGMALGQLRRKGLRIRFDVGSDVPSEDDTQAGFISNTEPIDLYAALARFADQLSKSATEHNPARKGPRMHRTSVPGAMFTKPIDDAKHKKLTDRATVLGFHLVFWLRVYTERAKPRDREDRKELPWPWEGTPMPKVGAPHYPVAEEFVRCALGEAVSENLNLSDRLRKLKEMQYLNWRPERN